MAACGARHETPRNRWLYEALDSAWAVASWRWPTQLRPALCDHRFCIMVPVGLARAIMPDIPLGYSDARDGATLLYASSPGLDKPRAGVLAILARSLRHGREHGWTHPWESDMQCLQWMIHRLEKVATLGWDGFRAAYK